MRWILFPPFGRIVAALIFGAMAFVPLTLVLIASRNSLTHVGAWMVILSAAVPMVLILFPGTGRWGGKLRRGWFSSRYGAQAREVEFGRDFVTVEFAADGKVQQETLRGFIVRF